MAKILSDQNVSDLAVQLGKRLGLDSMPPTEVILTQMRRQNSLPQIYGNGSVRVWVDLYYIAYSYEDEPDVHYYYVTDLHVWEEMNSYRVAREWHKSNVRLPADIRKQFSGALAKMRKSGKNYVILKS